MKQWTPEFRPNEETFRTTLVWIRITGLNIWYYHEKAMRRIAGAIEEPIKIDLATKEIERGKFARAYCPKKLGLPSGDRMVKLNRKTAATVGEECEQIDSQIQVQTEFVFGKNENHAEKNQKAPIVVMDALHGVNDVSHKEYSNEGLVQVDKIKGKKIVATNK
nr:uncharacterized protein LOC112763058 [Arachis hypogaea]